MGVSRSGYYKHLKLVDHASSRVEHRKIGLSLVNKTHSEHPSHGYRWVAAYIRRNTPYTYSDSFVYKAFRFLNIQSETKHKKRYRPRKIKDKYPNLIFAAWQYVDRPRQVIVSDMTSFYVGRQYYELTMYFDVFTKQILSWSISDRRGAREPYLYGLQKVLDLLEIDSDEPTYLHTDQGSVYASLAYNKLAQEKNLIRSMSRSGTPTDNPVNESLNGWIKEELFIDFHLEQYANHPESSYYIRSAIGRYVDYYNEIRPCFAIGYSTPNDYYNQFRAGALSCKNTFEKRFESVLPPSQK